MEGAPKGLEVVGGIRIIDRVADALSGASDRLLLAANDPVAATWLPGISVVTDTHPGAGGMAGVEAALLQGADVLVVAWDMPFVPGRLLLELTQQASTYAADVVVPESDSPYGFEPFCAYYSARVQPALSQFLGEGGGAARDFIARVERVRRMPLRDVGRFGDVATLFLSVNSRQELERARTIAANAG
jgi:molybdopterin-guanine dinucleotide biosynthesis protein A